MIFYWENMKKDCLFIFLVALVIRIAIVWIDIIPESVDSPGYYRIAYSLIEGKGYSDEGVPTAVREPGYPFFLASIFLIFGKNFFVVKIIQVILNSFCALFLYFIIKGISNKRRYGILGGIMFAISPSLFIQPSYILGEPLTVFIITFHLFFLYKLFFSQKKALYSLLSGISISLLILIKAITFLIPFFEIIIILKAIRKPKIAFLFLISSYFLVSFWMGRNMIIFDDKNPVRALRRNPDHPAWIGIQVKPVWPMAETEFVYLSKLKNEILARYGFQEGEKYLMRDTIRMLAENPFGVIKNVLILNFYSFIEANGAYMFSKKSRLGGFMIRLWHWLTLLFLIIGIFYLAKKCKGGLYIFLLIGIYLYFVILMIPLFPIPRYYVPILPIANIFAACGLGCIIWKKYDINE